ncbi:hypothetical protein [Poriferisphaera sp. WC338]|uniref:hypothetical protein n=1 Tax=Poriferisphaera sp. WC338 TaxID=3425129 RepID=UPI003D81BDFE
MKKYGLMIVGLACAGMGMTDVAEAGSTVIGSALEQSARDHSLVDGVMDTFWGGAPSASHWSEVGEVRGQVYFDLFGLEIQTSSITSVDLIYTANEVIDYAFNPIDSQEGGAGSIVPGPRDVTLAAYGASWDDKPSINDADDANRGMKQGTQTLQSMGFGQVPQIQEVGPQEAIFDVTNLVKDLLAANSDGVRFTFVDETFETAIDLFGGFLPLQTGGSGAAAPNYPFRLVLNTGGTPAIPTPSAIGLGALMLGGLALRRKQG